MELYLRRYACEACDGSTFFWVPLPPPTNVVLKGGGCQHCTTPQDHFRLWGAREAK